MGQTGPVWAGEPKPALTQFIPLGRALAAAASWPELPFQAGHRYKVPQFLFFQFLSRTYRWKIPSTAHRSPAIDPRCELATVTKSRNFFSFNFSPALTVGKIQALLIAPRNLSPSLPCNRSPAIDPRNRSSMADPLSVLLLARLSRGETLPNP